MGGQASARARQQGTRVGVGGSGKKREAEGKRMGTQRRVSEHEVCISDPREQVVLCFQRLIGV